MKSIELGVIIHSNTAGFRPTLGRNIQELRWFQNGVTSASMS